MEDRHVIVVVALILVAILLWNISPPKAQTPQGVVFEPDADADLANLQTVRNTAEGPAYLIANAPYAFGPPVQHIRWRTTRGAQGIGWKGNDNAC